MKIEIKEKRDGGGLIGVIIAAAMFVSMAGAFLSAAELNILTKFSSGGILNGLKLICNQIFETSEKYQAYKYIRFTVNPQESYMPALLLIISIIAGFAAVAAKFKNILIYAPLFFIFTGFQIYFGIFAAPVWNIIFYASLALAGMRGGNRNNTALFLITVSAVCALVYLTYQGTNPALAELSEKIRDQFGEKIEAGYNPQNHPEDVNIPGQPPNNLQARENPAGSDSGGNDSEKYKVETEENFSGSQIGAAVSQGLLFVLIIISVVVLAFAFRLLLIIVKASKRRKQFDSPDCAFAVNLMFNYLMRFLAAFGLKPEMITDSEKNIFSYYAAQLEHIISPQYSKEYLEISVIWLETAYSEHETTPETRQKVRLFLNKTPELLAKKVDLFSRMKIKAYWLCK